MGKGHFAAMDLSPDAQTVVHSGFLANATLKAICAAVAEATGETINQSSLANYRTWWKTEKRRALEARDIVRDAAESLQLVPADQRSQVVDQKLETLALIVMERLEASDPKAIIRLLQNQRRLDLSRDKLEVDKGKAELQDQKLKLDQERLQLERDKQAAIDRPSLFLEFWKMVVETIAGQSPEGAAVINQHFDAVMAKVKAGAV
jgi:hypothetical protein